MLSQTMQDALNKQINEELFSAYVYLAMAAEADRIGLPGFNNWFKLQYQEELAHADRFFNYILERNGEVHLDSIGRPEIGEESALSLFEKGLNKILEKVGEEATEAIIAAKDGDSEEIIKEVADLWFHSLVMLSHLEIDQAQVQSELANRFGVSGLVEKANRH